MAALLTMRVICGVVLLLVYGVGCYAVVAGGAKRPPGEQYHPEDQQEWCNALSNCTSWCSDCSMRGLSDLQSQLDRCPVFKSSIGYRHAVRCTNNNVCICPGQEEEPDATCKSCGKRGNNTLVCFSLVEDYVHVILPNGPSFMQLSDTCPSCSCSTKAPTTQRTTTPMLMPTVNHHDDNPDPRPTQKSMTTAADNKKSNQIIIIGAAVGGGVLLIVILVCLLICCWRKRAIKAEAIRKSKEQEYAYIDSDEIRTMRSQASMMSRQHLVSHDGLNRPPCGHRNFNNELYGMNAIGNGSSLSTQPHAPELPGNHPPPSIQPPMPSQYQGLNRGPLSPGILASSAFDNGPCPHCHQTGFTDRSATAPLMDRPAGLDVLPPGVEGTRSPYMALIKTNTCPTPGTPPAPLMCNCHSKPLSECSSASGSLQSDRQRNHSQAADALNATAEEADHEGHVEDADTPEDPYYFKMQTAAAEQEAPSSPHSHQYFKLEDAETIHIDGEDTPMLSSPDSNGNNVHTKTLPASMDSAISDKQPLGKTVNGLQVAAPGETPVRSPDRTASQDTTKSMSLQNGSVEGLPNGDYMHLVEGKSKVTTV